MPVENAGNLSGCARDVDGADASAQLRTTGKGLELELENVADGAHRVRIQAHPSRVFGDSVDETFTIHVDTQQARAGAQPRAARLAADHRDQRARRARLDARAELRGRAASS